MRDLHKLYEPPIPKHQIPTNNPFYNKSLISKGGIPTDASLMSSNLGHARGKSAKRSSPRSLLSWINSPNTKRVQQKMANRVSYLKMLAQHKNTLLSDVAALVDNNKNSNGGNSIMSMEDRNNATDV